MAASFPLRTLGDRPALIYAGGLAAIVVVRVASVSRSVRVAVVSVALGVMVLTFVAERGQGSGVRVAGPAAPLVGIAGVVAGVWLSTAGRPAGLAFLAGGLLFLSRSLRGGDRA